jgi:hypothetical protein
MDIQDKEVPLINVEEQPPEKVVVDISAEEISFDIIEVKNAVVLVEEKKPDLLVLTTGGSLYQFAQGQGYTGTELEWMTELLESKASVQFVVDTIANETQATATTILQLEAELENKYAKLTQLSTASSDLNAAIAQQRIDLVAKIGEDISASSTQINSTIAALDFAMTEQFSVYNTNFQANNTSISQLVIGLSNETAARINAVNDLSVVFDNDITGRISQVYDAIATETSVRVSSINTLSSQLTSLIGSQIQTVNEAVATETLSRASQVETLRADFTDGLSSVITALRTVETDVDGNSTAIDSITGIVTNPTTGLTAAFGRANQAYTLADGTAGALATLDGIVKNPVTGLEASFSFTQQVKLDGETYTNDAITELSNNITGPNAMWVASNQFIQSINTKAVDAASDANLAIGIANNAQGDASAAKGAAEAANNQLLAISSDSVLSKGEKPAVILNVTNILNEQAGITAEGVRYGISTARVNYTNAISTLVTYLNGLTPPYNDTTQNTPIDAATFRDRFADVYTKRQILLDAIAKKAKDLADAAQGTANTAITNITTLSNNLQSDVNGYIAENELILEIKEDLKGNIETTSGLSSSVTTLNGFKTSANLTLTTHSNKIGTLESRAFLGVTSTADGKATIAGITIDSVNYSLTFQGDIFELVNTSGVRQLYYNTTEGQWQFSGGLVASSFKTATTGYRVEMDGSSDYPIWYGQGDKNSSNGLFYTDKSGNVVMQNATMYNASIQGSLVTDSGNGYRTEIVDDGTYLVWIGAGAKEDTNGLFWIKRNGTGFIKGSFFQGEIIETRFASYSSLANEAALATINYTHNSAGKTIEITGSGSASGYAQGGDYSSVIWRATGRIFRSGNLIDTVTYETKGVYNAELNRTTWNLFYPASAISTGHGAGQQAAQYQVIFEVLNGSTPNFAFTKKTATVKTFENKLE